MWIDYKEVENLLTAEMWKSLLEGEGLPAKILPVEGILEWSENTKFRLSQTKPINYDDFDEEQLQDNKYFLKIDDYRYHIGFEMAKINEIIPIHNVHNLNECPPR